MSIILSHNPLLCYNLAMESGGTNTKKADTPKKSDLERAAAAAILRQKVLATYVNSAKPANGPSHLKDETPKIDSESWKKYHTAWQDYYRKYYSDYYSNAAKNYIAKEQLKNERDKAETEEILNQSAVKTRDNLESSFKSKIREKAIKNAKKSRKFQKFIPIFAGLAVVLFILFLQYNRLIFAPIMAYVSPGNMPASEIEAVDPTITTTVSAEPKLIIPKLNVDVPIRFGLKLADVMSAMNNGVAHYRISGASAYPGEIGNFIITGHSAGDIYSSNPYKYIFSGLERLEEGDLIYVNYDSTRYTYRMTGSKVIEPTDVDALVLDTDKPMLTLVTCTPLGTSKYRLLVFAEQISPSYDSATDSEDSTSTKIETTATALPNNEPTFFESIWNWLIGN